MSEIIIDTLFELLSYYSVEVPIIQRDYAQGRLDDHATMVRNTLLADMKSALLEETKPLDLNFVYGKLDGEKFIPLDGQQRLTTLFLLHLYAFKDDNSKTDLLGKFTYKTRTSSRDFLEILTQNRESVFSSELSPSKEIKDSEWFVAWWKYDPTIQSVLVMLDAIMVEFQGIEDLADKLIKNEFKPITFKFLEMENLGMEDSLYIKLNARGKPLTSFENFKARLIGRLQHLNLENTREFEQHVDTSWTDLFWSKGKESFDKTYLLFFGVLFMNKEICTTDSNWTNNLDFKIIDSPIFEEIYFTLDFLCTNPDYEIVHEIIFKAVSERRTYQDRILFHAVTTYLCKSRSLAQEPLYQWLRIVKNLTFNSEIDTLALYRRAIEGVNELASNWDDLLSYFAAGGKAAGFSREQIEEEQEKASIILHSESFAETIYSAEKHVYFSGQIRSALHYGKSDDGSCLEPDFIHYWEKIASLFDVSKPKHGNLLRRALLTFGDYTLPVASYKTLCVDDAKEAGSTPSMKRLFSNHGNIVKNLLDSLNGNNDIEKQLHEIVNKSTVPHNDWRYCFINFPELFEEMSISHLRLRNVSGELIIVPNKSSNGYNYGVFLSALCEALEQQGLNATHNYELGMWAERYLTAKDYKVLFKNYSFILVDRNGTKVWETSSSDFITEVITYLQQ